MKLVAAFVFYAASKQNVFFLEIVQMQKREKNQPQTKKSKDNCK